MSYNFVASLCWVARVAFVFLCFSLKVAQAASLANRVLLIYNSAPGSRDVAEYYMHKRGIPASNACKISTSSTEAIEDSEFQSQVKEPVRKCLDRLGKKSILYMVLSYGTPFAITLTGQRYALDSFLEDVWDEVLPYRPAEQSEVQPYFGVAQSEGGFYEHYVSLAMYREKPAGKHLYSVWRLDGRDAALSKGLVDKAIHAEQQGLAGRGCFDRGYGDMNSVADFSYGAGDWDISQAGRIAQQAGFRIVEDDHKEEFGTPPAPSRCDGAALYAGWYSLDHYNDAFTWNPGAVGIHLDSASAANPRKGSNWAANALKRGITVTSGAVAEPYLENLPHPDQAFLYLFEGANVGDAFLRSTRLVKWRIVNIGDPLYCPFRGGRHLSLSPESELMLILLPQATIGGTLSAGIIALNGAASDRDLTFDLRSERPELVELPKTITLPKGSQYVKFLFRSRRVDKATTVRVFVVGTGLSRTNLLILSSPSGTSR